MTRLAGHGRPDELPVAIEATRTCAPTATGYAVCNPAMRFALGNALLDTSMDGASWIPGHSAFSGAASVVFTSFTDAADQAGWSRCYGGIPFEDGDLKGRTLGHQVGTAVWAKAVTYIQRHRQISTTTTTPTATEAPTTTETPTTAAG